MGEVARFCDSLIEPDRLISLWTIYYNPSDYPGFYVARYSTVTNKAQIVMHPKCFVAGTLEVIRRLLPRGLSRLERMPEDDECIVEVWL